MKQALVILTLLGGIAFSAQAHEVWLERNTDGSVKVQFGEPGSEQASAEELASLSAARIFAANAKTPLTATAQADHLLVKTQDSKSDISFYADTAWQPWKTETGLQAAILYARTGQEHTKALQDFEFTPVKSGAPEFVLSYKGAPLVNHPVQVYRPGFWSKSFTTDAQGKFALDTPDAGRYLLVSNHTTEGKQTLAGNEVDSVLHITTTSFITQ
ncbi:nickel transporter [Shewanella sp.]|uniref:nickel transporter n=1 Tax=Shewanella sp. TaxID=50422 RepID=UPI000E8EAFE3|nr:nickel transporter [Shewanella sp.]HAY94982.1 nickel transporter [Shewanella sp.]